MKTFITWSLLFLPMIINATDKLCIAKQYDDVAEKYSEIFVKYNQDSIKDYSFGFWISH